MISQNKINKYIMVNNIQNDKIFIIYLSVSMLSIYFGPLNFENL